jgi:hypothetical protein
MKRKGSLIGVVVIIFAITFIGAGEVGATNCYNLYYNESCVSDYLNTGSFDSNWGSWAFMRIALHKDMSWESYNYVLQGNWMVFGNAIFLNVLFATSELAPAIFINEPLLAGVKSGSAKFIVGDPQHSKANISKAQGFFKGVADDIPGCWYLQKVKNELCDWID